MDTAFEQMDDEQSLEVAIHDMKLAGTEPGSRWGRIKFDENGDAKVKCKKKDIHKLHELKWLGQEDQDRFGMESLLPPTAPMEMEQQKIVGELSALTSANVKLAQRAAMVEAECEQRLEKMEASCLARMKSQDEKFNTTWAADMKAKDAVIADLEKQLAAATAQPVVVAEADTKPVKKAAGK